MRRERQSDHKKKTEFFGSRVNLFSNFNIKIKLPQCHNHKEYTCQVSLSYGSGNTGKIRGESVEGAKVTPKNRVFGE